VHYDQVGGGRSTLLPEKGADFWTVQLFLDELDNLLEVLGIAGRYNLLGQSWAECSAPSTPFADPRDCAASF